MSIIKPHNITLYGIAGEHNVILRPLCDEHFPLLYKWNSDTELLYWVDGERKDEGYTPELNHRIYGGTSQSGYCFLIEVNGEPVGECWLSSWYSPELGVHALYREGTDIRRIDMAIGEKSRWGKGIGTAVVGILVDFAFNGEYVDILHCITYGFNVRSRRAFEKNGFVKLEMTYEKFDCQLRLTRAEWIERRRVKVQPEAEIALAELQPTQLYVSEGKLRVAREWFNAEKRENFDPIPIKKLNGGIIMTDGHTRAALAAISGWERVPCYWDTDPLDMEAYAKNVEWCAEAGISSALDLIPRIVSHIEYHALWHKLCLEM